MGVVRELTENRSKLACARTNLAERLAELQHEYMRLMRVADLSRVVSKENVAKAAKATRSLSQVSFWQARSQSCSTARHFTTRLAVCYHHEHKDKCSLCGLPQQLACA